MSSPTDTFLQEADDLLAALEEALLELDENPQDAINIANAFRALHTLKGSGNMFGFRALGDFIHHFEDCFEKVRNGSAFVTPDLVAVALASRDHIAALLDLGPDTALTPELAETDRNLLAKLGEITGSDTLSAADRPSEDTASSNQPNAPVIERRWHIRFRPEPGSLGMGVRPDLLLAELSGLGRTMVTPQLDAVPGLDSYDPAECYIAWIIELVGPVDRAAIEDVFLFQMDAELTIEETQLEAQDMPEPAENDAALPDRGAEKTSTPAKGQASGGDSVRVQASRLDDLMNQLGELVIAQARLKAISSEIDDPRLSGTAEEIEALVTGLRDTTLSIRMLPVSMVFGKFRRLVRDLSSDLGKAVALTTEGGETEVDKNIIDALTDPLVHMVRNSIDHGVESADIRAAQGKPETATICLRAEQAGGEVLITVSDDGGGLDTEAIRARAIERKLISSDQSLSAAELHQLIFEPGFSTAETISNVSGRGVGMDAVRGVIDALRGTIDVRSRPGEGTEVTLRLPLTLAIIDGLMVRVDDDHFVIPLAAVEECVDLPDRNMVHDNGRRMLQIRESWVPYIDLDQLFGFGQSGAKGRRVVVVTADGRRIGFAVDDVVGQLQTVIKPLSRFHRSVEGLAGATILGDGSVALILDANAIVRRADAVRQIAA
ncbi:chemotaxis protein CheA [Aestuariivita boseongensis]|uniref:chemotaxis protein CheA n=1 Tax=Aestuariivita boseongensis TaxID=1470562 RepID=UPI0006807B8A|nr:chemotaxis protein CheA [Aestuariivita boseongensis]